MKINYNLLILIALIIGMIVMFYQFGTMNKEGLECRQQPFIYGAKGMSEQNNGNHVSCSCMVGQRTFSFNEKEFNPK